jgi:hypothetical protein
LKLILTNEDYAALSRKAWLIKGDTTSFVACTITALEGTFIGNVTSRMQSKPSDMKEYMSAHRFGYYVLYV